MLRRSAPILLAPLLLAAAPAPQAPGPAQPPASPTTAPSPATPPERIADEFDGAALSSEWTLFHARYGWPAKIRSLSVEGGLLRLQPFHSAWVRDLNAPFLFRTVAGDFDVRARVRMKGRKGPIAGGTWSLGGLMARVPNGLDAASWQANRENWHFITTGVGYEAGKPVTETKGTYNSYSSLKLRPWHEGWTELRLVRVGMALFALARPDGGGPWRLRDRFYRMEMSPAMQVGLIAYTTSPDVPPGPEDARTENRIANRAAAVDALLEVDWIRAARPAASRPAPAPGDRGAAMAWWYDEVRGANPLTDPNLPEAEVLRLLGD
jgi:hypothetical protein